MNDEIGRSSRVCFINAASGQQDIARNFRQSGRTKPRDDTRSESQRDRDRIIYSSAWRRLAGVTQVVTPFSDLPLLHNRLTHSEKVAQVARSIAENLISDSSNWPVMSELGGFDVDVCEAAGLAHDLGHPPFGHVGERVLDKAAQNRLRLSDGFEGNAQTLRILCSGKIRSQKYEGLDLTRATLAAVSKYPWIRTRRITQEDEHQEKLRGDATYRRHWVKFNAYIPQEQLLQDVRSFLPPTFDPETQTLEASVMDVADDITYAIHDLEDFYISQVLDTATVMNDIARFLNPDDTSNTPLLELTGKLTIDYEEWFDFDQLREAAKFVESVLRYGFISDRKDFVERESAAREKCSELIGLYINSVDISKSPLWQGGPHVGLRKEQWHQIQIFKAITRSYVVQRPDFALLQRGQEAVLESFVKMLNDWSTSDSERLPAKLKREFEIAEEQSKGLRKVGYYGTEQSSPRGKSNRAILDYVCGLTDQECLQIYYNLSGIQIFRPGMISG